jgi:hypothetical protein
MTNEIQYKTLDDNEYQEMKELLESHDYEVDENAFACFIVEDQYIMLRKGFVDSVSEGELSAVIAHELAHLEGIMDEEEADRWAVENLEDDDSKQVLIDMWEHRHGHQYYESK